jgi:hemerythrin-like domain-containing protein
MAEASKPIKRSPELAPLSREHHEGLLAAWKIRQGLSKNIAPARIIAFVQWFWQQHLKLHFEKEETNFPLVLSKTHSLMRQMFEEHAAIERNIQHLDQYEGFKKLEQLAQLLNDHIRFEERYLFGAVEEAASEEQLKTLSQQLKDEKPAALWEDEFWVKTN